MSRTYIQLNLSGRMNTVSEGGVYLDQISLVRSDEPNKTVLLFLGQSNHYAVINKPLKEVEQMLAWANRTTSEHEILDWRDVSGKPQPQAKHDNSKAKIDRPAHTPVSPEFGPSRWR